MHRLLTDTEQLKTETPQLSREAAKHLKVLRPKDGEVVELFDGKGGARVYHWQAAHGTLGAPEELRFLPRREKGLTLFACVTKGSRWDWTIEKATELGVTALVPVISDRTIVRIGPEEAAAKQERWMRIAEEAARQSDAVWLPEIAEPMSFAASLARVKATHCLIGALTTPPSPPIATAAAGADAVFVGPEGDFTPEELQALMKIATPVSFGPTILRAETAAIFAVSVLAAAQANLK